MADDNPSGRKPAREQPAYQAPALEKGLEILEFLSRHTEPHGLADLAKALQRSKNEIYRMALVLERRGYIERTSDDRFLITNRLFQLGMQNPPMRNLHDAALPTMHALAEQLGQSCHLAVASQDDIVVVARVESPGLLGFAVRVGYRRHIVEATSGRILFGLAPAARREAWLRSLRHSAPRQADVAGFPRLAEEASAAGHAVAPSSIVPGIMDIAAPVFDGVHPGPVAALTVPFLPSRSERTDVADARDAVVASAQSITHRLTHG